MGIDALLAGFAALALSALVIYALTSDNEIDEKSDQNRHSKDRR